jgi:hypothetical protein
MGVKNGFPAKVLKDVGFAELVQTGSAIQIVASSFLM